MVPPVEPRWVEFVEKGIIREVDLSLTLISVLLVSYQYIWRGYVSERRIIP